MEDTALSGSRPVLGSVKMSLSALSLFTDASPHNIIKYSLPGGLDGRISVDVEQSSPNSMVTIRAEGLSKDVDVLFKGQINWKTRPFEESSGQPGGGSTSDANLWLRGNGSLLQLTRGYTRSISGTVTVYGPPTTTLTDVSALRSLTALADVTLRAAGKDFPAHSVVLAARSPVFLTMFTSGFKEATNKVADIAVDCSAEVFAVFVDFFYSGALEKRNCTDLLALLELAERYMLADLKKECLRHLMGVGVEEALAVFQAGMQQPYVSMEVSTKAYKVICDNWGAVSSSTEWEEFAAAKPDVAFTLKVMLADKRNADNPLG